MCMQNHFTSDIPGTELLPYPAFLQLSAGNSSYQNVCNCESCWCWARNWRCSGAQESALRLRAENQSIFSLSHRTPWRSRDPLVSINQHDDDAYVFLCQGKGKHLPRVQGSRRLRRNLCHCHCNLLSAVLQWHKFLLCHHWHITEPIQRGVQVLLMTVTKPQQLQGWECLPLSLCWRTKICKRRWAVSASNKSPGHSLCLAAYQSFDPRLFILNHVYFTSFCRKGQFSLIFWC